MYAGHAADEPAISCRPAAMFDQRHPVARPLPARRSSTTSIGQPT